MTQRQIAAPAEMLYPGVVDRGGVGFLAIFHVLRDDDWGHAEQRGLGVLRRQHPVWEGARDYVF